MAHPIKPRAARGEAPQGDVDRLRKLQGFVRTWAEATESARRLMARDYEMAEGNGKQWRPADRLKVERTGRPALEFNQIMPQVELVAGMQRNLRLDFTALPRGLEDRRLGEVATATLKAMADFGRVQRVSDKVFDDATICGLGVWEVLHTMDDAEDLVWGDVTVERINPLAFLYDPWASQLDWQDGAFMGKAVWMHVDDFVARYPSKRHLAKPGEWMAYVTQSGRYLGTELGTGPNLLRELFDTETGRIRVLTLWHKVPTKISLIIDTETGAVREVDSVAQGEELLAAEAAARGREAVRKYDIVTQGDTSAVVDPLTGNVVLDPTSGVPLQFASAEAAQTRLNELANMTSVDILDRFQVVTRQARVPEWTELVWWEILDYGKTPYRDRQYPYVVYVSRRYSDDPESIQGIVRNLHDPQDEYNKRYSNILAHLNSSAHSGWLNRKAGGANRAQLEAMGSKPGIVVEFATVPPQQIRPIELSAGHFAMLQHGERSILRISGINAELVGQTTQTTVSGRAIRARQEGGSTILRPRFRSFEDAQLDLARMMLSRGQQYYPVEKIRRIIGVAELNSPLGPNGLSIFTDPVTGAPMRDEEIMALLTTMRKTSFDLVLRLSPSSASERQAQFEQAVQLAGLIVSSGRPLGPHTMQAMIDLADMPTRLAEGLKRDAEQPVNPALLQPGGQNDQVQRLIANLKSSNATGAAIEAGMTRAGV